MDNTISELPLYTGNTTGVYLIMNNSGETTTYKVTKETLITGSGTSGTSGSSGTSGVNGTSGSSGVSGSNGSSGTSGSSGTNGSSGSSGVDGTSGSSGVSGSNGISGTDGTSGSNGSSGTSGIDGTSGSSGNSGTNGSSGTSGIDGTSGSNGSSGTSGIDGTSGSNGSSGTSGIDGTSGSNGSSGTSGSNGLSGTNGSSGTSGIDGSSGTSGMGVMASYYKGYKATSQTNVTTGTELIFDTNENSFGSDISLNVSTGEITLKANKTYRLRSNVGYVTFQSVAGMGGHINFQWYDKTNSTYIGRMQNVVATASSTENNHPNGGTVEAVITPTTDIVVVVKIVSSIRDVHTSVTITVGSSSVLTWFDVEVIGGNAPVTNGTSGTSGSDGTSGTSGSDGTSGTSGSDGSSYGIVSSYYKGYKNNSQSISSSSSNVAVVFNATESSFGSDVSLNTSTGVITLSANKTYRIRGTVGHVSVNPGVGYLLYQWYNITNSQYIGNEKLVRYSSSGGVSDGTDGITEVIITLTGTTQISLNIRDRDAEGDNILISNQTNGYSWFDIEVIGGNNTVTNSTANQVITYSSNPSGISAGFIYFNTSDNHFYGYNGTTWKQLDN
jgi:collagen type VII alpha